MARDRGRCAFVGADGKRCASDRWVALHHRQHVENGGGNESVNLQTLCIYHHDLVHQLEFTFEDFMAKGEYEK